MHRKEGKNVLAVCDKEACNQTFEDGNLQIFVDPAFYGVKEVEEKELDMWIRKMFWRSTPVPMPRC
jgi:hypothetical protein